jgi:hypothetical protein
MTLDEAINITVNVACKYCGWTATYTIEAHALAGKDGAEHIVSAHPEIVQELLTGA